MYIISIENQQSNNSQNFSLFFEIFSKKKKIFSLLFSDFSKKNFEGVLKGKFL
jgi:hypothetical protein